MLFTRIKFLKKVMKAMLFILWFVSFMLMIMSVENLNELFWISFVVFGLVSYKINQKKYDIIK